MFALMQKTLVEYVCLKLPIYVLSMCTFDLWTSKGPHNVFGVIVNFMLMNWEPKHITISLFQASYTINATMAFQFLQLLTSFSYLEGVAYVKDEEVNL
jgi:ribulose 1,5-bisphosphate synthetase/thiazole synthase